MAVKVLRVRLAGRVLGAMERTLMSEDERAAYADDIQGEQAHDCEVLDSAMYDGWSVIGQGQMETDQGLFHYFVMQQGDTAPAAPDWQEESVTNLVDAIQEAEKEVIRLSTVDDDAAQEARWAANGLRSDLAETVILAHTAGYRMNKRATTVNVDDIPF